MNTSPVRKSVIAMALLSAFGAAPAWAAPCPSETDERVQAPDGEVLVCDATKPAYTSLQSPVLATGAGAVLTVDAAGQPTTLNAAGALTNLTPVNLVNADRGGRIVVKQPMSAVLNSNDGNMNPFGTAANAVLVISESEDEATSITFEKDLTLSVMSMGTGIRVVGPKSSAAIHGNLQIDLAGIPAAEGGANYGSFGVLVGNEGTLVYESATLKAPDGGQNVTGIYMDLGTNVTGNGDTSIEFLGEANYQPAMSVLGALTIKGKLNVNVPVASAQNLLSLGDLSKVSLGPNSVVNAPNGSAFNFGYRSEGENIPVATLDVASGLTLTAGTAFAFGGKAPSYFTANLVNATVTASPVWRLFGPGGVSTFTADGGTFVGGSVAFNENFETVGGDIPAAAGGNNTLVLTNGANWYMQTNSAYQYVQLLNSSALRVGNANLTLTSELLSNTSGVVDLTTGSVATLAKSGLTKAAQAVDIFKLEGSYAGGGQVKLDTVLGDSSSASDQIIIQGNASGITTLSITNLGGAGAQTTGNGILVATVTGSAADNAFVLAGNVAAGGFVYSLQRVASSWYLQAAPGPVEFEVQATAGLGGAVSAATQQVISGQKASVTLTPDSGYEVDTSQTVGGTCPAGTWSGNTYTTDAVVQACNMSFVFKKKAGPTDPSGPIDPRGIPQPVPTLETAGLLLLSGLMGVVTLAMNRRRQRKTGSSRT